MKKYFLIIVGIILALNLYAQSNSWDGSGIKPNSKFRSLNIFINVIYDVNVNLNDNFPGGAWPRAYNEGVNNEAIPNYLLGFMDTVYTSQNNGILTRQFGEASFDSLQIIGDFVVVNVKESRVLTFPIVNNSYCTNTPFCYNNIARAAIQLINETGGLQTLYGRNKISDYDFENKNQIYFAQTMIRNITSNYGGLEGGNGFGGAGISDSIKIGNQKYKFSGKGTLQCIGSGDKSVDIPSIISHEISHSLFGSNAFHTSGGNHRGSGNIQMPFLTIQGGHGLMGAAVTALVSCNAYERWRMHWKHPNAPNYITARDTSNSNYVVSDIKKEDGNKSFILRDFVTDGDAIRIQLPYKDSEDASNQYIWLENHKVGLNGKLDYFQWSETANCRPQGKAGIYAYYQIGRDILSGTSNEVWFSGERDNLKMISAEGYWNFSIIDVNPSYSIDCINWEWHDYLHERKDANPFCGYQDQERQIHPSTNANIIQLSHEKLMWRKRIGYLDIDSLPSVGDNRDAFSTHRKINMSTNPSTCNAKTYYNYLRSDGGYDYTESAHRNNETTYLTGLSIEMTPQSNNNFFVNIRWDDYDITNSANWTGKITLKEKAVLKNGKTINLKQNKTPAQFIKDATSGYFAKTSLFTCEENSVFHQEGNTAFIVDENSKILLKSGSKYTISTGANLTIKSGCTLEVEECATLAINGQLIVEIGANIIFHPEANIIMSSLSKIVYSGNVQQLIYPYIWENPTIIGNVTINHPTTFSNVEIHHGATLTITSTVKMANHSEIFIYSGGKLIIDGGTITYDCDENMWQGITIFYDPSSPLSYGSVEIINGGTIENANTAITVEPGGIVYANNANIKNYKQGISFFPLQQGQSGTSGTFINTNFEVNNNNLVSNNNFEYHLNIFRCGKVLIENCSFTTPQNFSNKNSIIVDKTTTNWTGTNYLNRSNSVSLLGDATMSLTGTVYCGYNSGFTVHPTAKLSLFNATLSNTTQGQLWKGITVLGNPNQPLNKNYQGYVDLLNSTIENAEIGITAKDGGLVDVNRSFFTNNLTGVKFEPISSLQTGGTSGTFQDTKFVLNNQDLDFDAHIKALSSGNISVFGCDFSSNVPQDDAYYNYGIFVSNTSFEIGLLCTTPNCPYNITMRNKFSGFNTAISAINTGTLPAFRARYCEFIDNENGISVNGINSSLIIRNEFMVNNTIVGYPVFATGVAVGNATGYKIEENLFIDGTITNGNNNAGLRIFNSGTPENEVYKNFFINFAAAQVLSGRNSNASNDSIHILPYTGLQTLCNEFTENKSYDILVGTNPGTIPPTISSIRGSQGSLRKSAGNLFDNAATLNISNTHPNYSMSYYYGSKQEEFPDSVSTNVNRSSAAGQNGCPTRNGPFDAIIDPFDGIKIIMNDESYGSALAQYDEWNEQYEYYLALLKGTEEGSEEYYEILDQVSYYSALKDNYFNWIIASVMNEAEGRKQKAEGKKSPSNFEGVDGEAGRGSLYETLRFLFSYRNHYTDNLSIAETYMAEHNYETALATLAQIYPQFELSEEQIQELVGLQIYIRWLQQLEYNEKSVYLLPENEIQYLVNFVETNIGRGRVFANNILCGLYGICKDDEVMRELDDEMMNEAESRKQKAEGKKSPSNFEGVDGEAGRGSLNDITLIPNPTNGELKIENNKGINPLVIEVFDVYGRNLTPHTANLLPHTSLDITDLASGVYFVKITTDKGIVTKKVVKN